MSKSITSLEPKELWTNFSEINAVPRPSKKEERIIEFMMQFGKKLGLEMLVDGDWVKANGTTLGADNGIGVASIMTVLASPTIEHPAIEALFTIDEETGMTGALNLKAGVLKGKILLNLDTEDDKELTIGCAGGIDVTATGSFTHEVAIQEWISTKVVVIPIRS